MLNIYLKTENMKNFLLVILTLISGIGGLKADEVSFIANTKKVVEVGERFQLTYTLNAEGNDFRGRIWVISDI